MGARITPGGDVRLDAHARALEVADAVDRLRHEAARGGQRGGQPGPRVRRDRRGLPPPRPRRERPPAPPGGPPDGPLPPPGTSRPLITMLWYFYVMRDDVPAHPGPSTVAFVVNINPCYRGRVS